MMTRARVVVLREYGFLGIEEITLPPLSDTQVLIELFSASIQPAQIRLVQAAESPGWAPVVPGLEGAGRIIAVGGGVTGLKVDDFAIVGSALAGAADGEPACAEFVLGQGDVQSGRAVSTWATHALVDERFVAAVPGDLLKDHDSLAVLGDTIPRVVAIVSRGGITPDARVAILGSRGTGTVTEAVCRASGVADIVMIGRDPVDAHRALDVLIICQDDLTDEEASGGMPVSAEKVFIVASPEPGMQSDVGGRPSAFADGQIVLVEPQRDLERAIALIREERLDIGAVVARRYTIEQINEAVLDLETGTVTGPALLIVEPLR
ncbi:alcohol dehydrogenase catalytic domain-containing protein [Henriciella litoralis]|uniref:alcohol dehydrogenase catalytic domain-containing protein n=1 Tax=Henriciella litoralis TaxID=568102 RepID=UPI0009FE0666|nr:hypothetical protein [Henriciella litoralis]